MNPRIAIILLVSIISIGAASAACVDVTAENLDELIAETPAIDEAIRTCETPPSLGMFRRAIGGNGALVIDVTSETRTESFTLSRSAGSITGFSHTTDTCSERVTLSEATLETILTSDDQAGQALVSLAERDVDVNGCTFGSRARLFVMMPIVRFFARRA